ncbi:hypothetical protein B0H16DRAFT_1776786 [Mycena metata]|uniref:RNase III domain-containing protein n=1 Tax=Mycena metata TaxID=1033252 RepID=A0AAD7JTB5_9AGAR|nr:hypothetical protein B0H16DRAFT_1776786 [Mycena metata]
MDNPSDAQPKMLTVEVRNDKLEDNERFHDVYKTLAGDSTSHEPIPGKLESAGSDHLEASLSLSEKHVDPHQLSINKVVGRASYTPQPVLLPPDTLEQVLHSGDGETLGCLEFLGDSRIKFHCAQRQVELYPNASLAQLNTSTSSVLSNTTFQRIAHAMGVDDQPVDRYSKAVGDGMEVYTEVVGRARSDASTQYWVNDILTPDADPTTQDSASPGHGTHATTNQKTDATGWFKAQQGSEACWEGEGKGWREHLREHLREATCMFPRPSLSFA